EIVRAAAAERDRSVLRRVHEQEADVRMLSQRRDQPRVPLLDLLEREPPRLVQQIDEAEVARGEHGSLASGYGVGPVRLIRAASRLLHGVPDHRGVLVTGADGGGLPRGQAT